MWQQSDQLTPYQHAAVPQSRIVSQPFQDLHPSPIELCVHIANISPSIAKVSADLAAYLKCD